jgi:hypothetical protein
MAYKFVLVNKSEVEKGEREEAGEHNFPPEQAHNVALQHLTKKDPHYYTKADAAGLEEWNDSVFTKDKTGGRMARIKKYKKKHPGQAFTVVGGSNIAGGQH